MEWRWVLLPPLTTFDRPSSQSAGWPASLLLGLEEWRWVPSPPLSTFHQLSSQSTGWPTSLSLGQEEQRWSSLLFLNLGTHWLQPILVISPPSHSVPFPFSNIEQDSTVCCVRSINQSLTHSKSGLIEDQEDKWVLQSPRFLPNWLTATLRYAVYHSLISQIARPRSDQAPSGLASPPSPTSFSPSIYLSDFPFYLINQLGLDTLHLCTYWIKEDRVEPSSKLIHTSPFRADWMLQYSMYCRIDWSIN